VKKSKIKILYCGLKYDYGKPLNGFSFEHNNFYQSFMKMREIEKVDYVAMDELILEHGQNYLNEEIIKLSKINKYDLIFFFLFKDEIFFETLDYLKQELSIPTVAWMADDHWRFENYSKYIANHFSYVATTDKNSLQKYREHKIYNVIHSQWACNHFAYKSIKKDIKFGVTFVGMLYGSRGKDIEYLNDKNNLIQCWGQNWQNGKLSLEKKIEVYSNSLINLNFSKSSQQKNLKNFIKIFLSRNTKKKLELNKLRKVIDNSKNFIKKNRNQIKARVFEVPGCNGFLLTENCENIEDYFILDKEIVVFHSIDEAKDKIKYYLKNQNIAKNISFCGYERVLKEHTYEKRFQNIFKKVL